MYRLLCTFIIIIYAVEGFSSQSVCRDYLNGEVSLKLSEEVEGHVRANGVLVTGAAEYSLDFVITNLGLEKNTLSERWKGKRALSIGEGMSGLLPFLLEQNLNIIGADLWYETSVYPDNRAGILMREYVSKYGEYLKAADIQSLPFENDSFDVILAHMIVNNLPMNQQVVAINEIIRVLSTGGEARLFGFTREQAGMVASYLDEFRSLINFNFDLHYFEHHYGESVTKGKAFRLVLLKK